MERGWKSESREKRTGVGGQVAIGLGVEVSSHPLYASRGASTPKNFRKPYHCATLVSVSGGPHFSGTRELRRMGDEDSEGGGKVGEEDGGLELVEENTLVSAGSGVEHVPGKAFTMPDALSRYPRSDRHEESETLDVERRILTVGMARAEDSGLPLSQTGRYRVMETFLSTLGFEEGTPELIRKWVKRRVPVFFLQDGQLWRQHSPIPLIVATARKDQDRILQSLHEELGHRGVVETRKRVKSRFWWPGVVRSV